MKGRRRTREERKLRVLEAMIGLLFAVIAALLTAILISALSLSAEAEQEPAAVHLEEAAAYPAEGDGRLAGDDVPASERCYLTEGEIDNENQLILEALIAKANRIDSCTVTWYTNETCGKTPDDPTYGITSSGLPTVEGLTCAVDNRVIPRYADVFVQFADGSIQQYWATDTGVVGNHVDIFEPDYDTAIQNGRQVLTVWWLKETGT